MQAGGYQVDILIQGFPGKTLGQGGLGWSTVALLRGHGHVAVLDTGNFNVRATLTAALARHGITPADVTDLLLSHLHYDHCMNWPMFPHARIATGAVELDWALAQPAGNLLVPELYVAPLPRQAGFRTVADGDTVLPGITAHLTPGHTPGHLTFLVAGEPDIILVQDAAKYRSELLTRQADMTYDPAVTAASIERIWALWRRQPGSIVLPGHDLPMTLEAGQPRQIGEYGAGIVAMLGDTIDARTTVKLG